MLIFWILFLFLLIIIFILMFRQQEETNFSVEYELNECYYQLDQKKKQIKSILVTIKKDDFLEKSKILSIIDNICRNFSFKILINNSKLLSQQESTLKYFPIHNKQPTCEFLAFYLFSLLEEKIPFLKLKEVKVISENYSASYSKKSLF